MDEKPTYEELEKRIKELEIELAACEVEKDSNHLFEYYFKAFLDNTNLPVFLKDDNYRYLFINHRFENLAHITNDQVRGKDDFAVFPEPIAELFRSQDEKVKARNTLLEFTETIQLADGEHTCITAKFPLHDDAGNIYAIAGVCTDITELEQARKKLVESEEKYRNLIETVSLGIQISDREGRITLSNTAHHKILGFPLGELVGRYVWDFTADESKQKQLQEDYKQIIRHQPEPEPYLIENRTRDGRVVTLRIDWNYMREKNGFINALCSVIHVVTEK